MRSRLLTGVVAALLLISFAAPANSQEEGEVTPARVSGENRFGTAADTATLTYPDGASTAVLANGMGYADALASSYIAGVLDAPILLTMADQLPAETEQALDDLGVDEIMLVGGVSAISADVSDQLIAQGYSLARVDGADRYETAAAASLRYGNDPVGTVGGERVAILASGENFPDALAVGPVAYGNGFPLLLARSDALSVPTISAVGQLEIDRLIVVGGEAVLPPDEEIQQQLQPEAGNVEITRISGSNRYATAAQVSDFALAELGWTPELTLLSRGDTFPDALAASPHGGANEAPLILSESPSVLGSAAEGWLNAACPDVDVVRALGGTAAIWTSVLDEAVSTAEDCEPDPVIDPDDDDPDDVLD